MNQSIVVKRSLPLRLWYRVLDHFCSLGPLAVGIFITVCGLSILGLSRAALTLIYIDRFKDTPNYLMLFLVGIRMDLILLSFATIAPTILLFSLPKSVVLRIRWPLTFWYTGFMGLLVYMECATFPFVEEYDLRPDQKFLEYLGHVREVATMLLKAYWLELIIGGVLLLLSLRFFWRSCFYLITNYKEWRSKTRLVVAPVVAGVLFLGARSSVGHRPANLSTAAFSENHLANEFALNSTYSMFYAAYRMLRHEKNPSLDYGKMDRAEIISRVQKNSPFSVEESLGEIPFLHQQRSPFTLSRPANVVIILQESMGAVDVGCLKGPPITPHICRLKDEGLWLSNLYATGTRTVRGIEATVSGFLPTSAVGVLKLPRAKNNFFTAAELFSRHGYTTEFMYGGMSNFDEMRSFFLGNGFKSIYDEPTFENPVFHGTWGVSDEDLMIKANQVFKSHGDKPFFSLILSTSNHLPYEFPDGRIELYEQPKQTHYNAIKYADYALGVFFDLAKKESYYQNTIFLVVADHNSHVRGNEHVPIDKFHIPGFIIGPNVPKQEFTMLSSQIDLLPTLLHFTGLETQHPMIGRNLMDLPDGTKGRAFMQYGSNNAYQIEDKLVISRPHLAQDHYQLDSKGALQPTTPDPEMGKDALAYAHLPWILYSEKRYKLP